MTQEFKVGGVLYRQQFRKCGKPDCKCNGDPENGIEPEPHGPYWYSYDGQSAAKYVGKELPAHVTDRAKLLKASAARFKKLKQELTKKRDEHYREYNKARLQLQAVQSLESGERVDSSMLAQLGLARFNGHEKGGA